MKVGIVTEWFERGAAYVSKAISESLRTEGLETFIYSRSEHYRKNQDPWGGDNVWLGRYSGLPVAKSIDRRDFEAWIESTQVSVIVFNEQHWLEPVRWAKKLGLKTIAYVDYYTQDTLFDFSIYDGLICVTQRHLAACGWHPNVFFCKWGTDVKLFAPRPVAEERPITFFHSFGWDPYRKGTDVLIRAFSKLVDKQSARLVVHGQADLLRTFPELRPNIERLLVGGTLSVVRKTVPAPGLYSLGDVYVYPSRLEGIGLTMAEALSSGLPLIATDNAPMTDFLDAPDSLSIPWTNYKTRSDKYFWPEVEPSEEWLVKRLEYWVNNSGRLGESTKRVREYAVSNLDWSKNSTALARFIQSTDTSSTPRLEGHEYRGRASKAMGPLEMFLYESLGRIWRALVKLQGLALLKRGAVKL